jgi:hypothetical protein
MGCNVTRSRFVSLYVERYIIYQPEAQDLLYVPPNLTLTAVFSEKQHLFPLLCSNRFGLVVEKVCLYYALGDLVFRHVRIPARRLLI